MGAYEENIDNRSYFVVIEIAILLTNFLTCVIILVVRIWRYIKAISVVNKFLFFLTTSLFAFDNADILNVEACVREKPSRRKYMRRRTVPPNFGIFNYEN